MRLFEVRIPMAAVQTAKHRILLVLYEQEDTLLLNIYRDIRANGGLGWPLELSFLLVVFCFLRSQLARSPDNRTVPTGATRTALHPGSWQT